MPTLKLCSVIYGYKTVPSIRLLHVEATAALGVNDHPAGLLMINGGFTSKRHITCWCKHKYKKSVYLTAALHHSNKGK